LHILTAESTEEQKMLAQMRNENAWR